jgi:hypothetical protein
MTTHASATPVTKECPYCAEVIRLEAVKCRFCGSDLAQPKPGTLRSRLLSASPLLAAVSLLIGVLGGIAELISTAANSPVADFMVRRDEPQAEPFQFGPGELESDDVRIVLLVAAVVIGLIGFAAALIARRRPGIASLMLLGAGASGLAVTLFVGVNLALLALAVLLLVAGLVIGAPTLRFRRQAQHQP